ncbi:hypothetical protein ABZ806_41095 [Spirillospora sp. NPDC047418]|jgi:hypothetical protein
MIKVTARDTPRWQRDSPGGPVQKVEPPKQPPKAKKIKLEIKRLEKVETTGLREGG